MAAAATNPAKLNRVIARVEPDIDLGLTAAEASARLHSGYANESAEAPERSTGRIIADNCFTYFNLIFVVLAVCVIISGSFKDLTFMPIVFINAFIGIVQELRSRAALRKMKIIAAPKATVIRDGTPVVINCDQAVLDDIVIFSAGAQIYADAIVQDGSCLVNEALVTGESDEITKKPGDTLLSGSFIVAGECRARLDKVGRESFVAKLTLEAKKSDKKMRSQMMKALNNLLKVIGIVIIPFGLIMLYQQLFVLKVEFSVGMPSTVAALIGMIPEGLYLLVSVALTVSVIRLAQGRTLVQDMRCIETLARVDVLCVDKTGTITEPEMNVREVVPLGNHTMDEVTQTLTDYLAGAAAENETLAALLRAFDGRPTRRASVRLPFSPSTKFAGAAFPDGRSYLLGAADKLISGNNAYTAEIERYSAEGYRVLLLAGYNGDIMETKRGLTAPVLPVALVLLTNKIRENAPKTFQFFARQGVSIRVISGDNPATVSRIALDAGIEGAERFVDASELKTERQIRRAAAEYIVFGRVTPDVKRRLIRALKAEGHTVAMTGDGVNDVLALKDADCGIAMASGSEVACHVAQLVLVDSDFAAMPRVVMEGRRVINNIERSSSLFLVKNIFSFLVTVMALAFTLSYPITPAQLTLFNVTCIGIPSFILALEPNHDRVRGRFLPNVLLNAVPAGLANVAAMLAVMFIGARFGLTQEELSAMTTIAISFVGMLMLVKVSLPFNKVRLALVIAMPVLFTLGAVLLSGLFGIVAPTKNALLVLLIACGCAVPLVLLFSLITRAISTKMNSRKHRLRKRRVRV